MRNLLTKIRNMLATLGESRSDLYITIAILITIIGIVKGSTALVALALLPAMFAGYWLAWTWRNDDDGGEDDEPVIMPQDWDDRVSPLH